MGHPEAGPFLQLSNINSQKGADEDFWIENAEIFRRVRIEDEEVAIHACQF